ncbi:shikimate kinase, partial [Caldisalinibacter kiritimatiensis]|uniref:shikimate kinase n=1 Tax=Caldisalinibacter kiritimatiensis TaxID=1304284 RepID=UPI000552DFD2
IIENINSSSTKRPLLETNNWKEKVLKLLNKRRNLYYASADYVIEIDNRNIQDIGGEIIRTFYKESLNL